MAELPNQAAPGMDELDTCPMTEADADVLAAAHKAAVVQHQGVSDKAWLQV